MIEKIRKILRQTIVSLVVIIFDAIRAILLLAQKALIATIGLPKKIKTLTTKEK